MAQRKMGKEMTVTSDGYHSKPTYVYKVVLLGSMAVGKSSLAFRYAKNSFRETMPTVGCSFFKQMIHLETANIMFEIWDTAGQEKYHSICHLYYRGARAALLVYDISRKETFNRAKLWLRELEKDFLHDEIVIILVGNKTDLATEREVTSEEGKEFARSKGLLHAETSAKSNHQVTDVFMAIGQVMAAEQSPQDLSAWLRMAYSSYTTVPPCSEIIATGATGDYASPVSVLEEVTCGSESAKQ